MRKLSKYEKETIINWNEGETIASIYTFNARLKRRLEDFSRKYPLLCRLEDVYKRQDVQPSPERQQSFPESQGAALHDALPPRRVELHHAGACCDLQNF